MSLLGPLDGLSERIVVSIAPSVGKHESTNRVALLISAMRVELSSLVSGLEVDHGLIDVPSDLNIIRGREELDTLESTPGNNTSAVTLLRAPCNLRSLGVRNQRVGRRRRPQAKV